MTFPKYALSLALLVFLLMSGCSSPKKIIVAEMNGDQGAREQISLDEFEKMYLKNNGGSDALQKASSDEKKKFLDLYLKFKLKVKEAYDRGYQNDPELRSELQEYRRNLSVSFLLSKELTDKDINQMYQRRLEEIRASHILVRVLDFNSPADTAAGWEKAMKIIDSLKSGKSFEEMAVNNSADPSAQTNKGDLYYFTSNAMVPDFENAVYSLPKGQFTPSPVRTQFGYHLIKVTDRKSNQGTVRVSHIMKRLSKDSTPEDSAKAWKDMTAALDSLKKGAAFETLAKTYSDDSYSSVNGGDIGFIERRRTVAEFDSAAYNTPKGKTSGIFKTQYGLHIVYVTEVKPVASFKELEPELRQFYQTNKFDAEYAKFVENLKKDFKFSIDTATVNLLAVSFDTAKTTSDPTWDSAFTVNAGKAPLFRFSGMVITVDSVMKLAKNIQELRGLNFRNPGTFDQIFEKVGKNLLVEHRARGMEKTSEEFSQLMKEYEQGVLLFKVEQNEVWNKVTPNDSLLRIFHAQTGANYRWQTDRVNIQEIYVLGDSLKETISFLLKKFPFDSVCAHYNQRPGTIEKNGETGFQPVNTNVLTQKTLEMAEGDVSDWITYENGFSLFKILKKDPVREKTFEEAMTEVSSAFQESESKRLGDGLYETLKKKFNAVAFPQVFDPAAAKESAK